MGRQVLELDSTVRGQIFAPAVMIIHAQHDINHIQQQLYLVFTCSSAPEGHNWFYLSIHTY